MGMSGRPCRLSRGGCAGRSRSRARVATAARGRAGAADAGKVLVFTGTAGTANPVSADAAAAITALGAANDFTVDTTAAAATSTRRNSRTTAPSCSSTPRATCSTPPGRSALQSYVQTGGGFVGIGETAHARAGRRLLRHADRPHRRRAHHRRAPSQRQDVEFLDRVHPATRRCRCSEGAQRRLLLVDQQPDGPGPHRRARALRPIARRLVGHQRRDHALHAARPPRTSRSRSARCRGAVTSSRAVRSTPASAARPPRSYDGTVSKHLLGAIQWASGMTRGNCKATITSNYRPRA